jgi:hypothetical protein
VQDNQSHQRRTAPALWRPSRGWIEVIILQNTRLEPGFELVAYEGRGLHYGQ